MRAPVRVAPTDDDLCATPPSYPAEIALCIPITI